MAGIRLLQLLPFPIFIIFREVKSIIKGKFNDYSLYY